MKVLKVILIIILIPILYVAGMILFGTLTDYRPPAEEPVDPATKGVSVINSDSLSLYIWNIGYAGLGKESDFFLDGGEYTRMSKALTEKNFSGIKSTVASWDDADFILLQEVDETARRSYGTNQFKAINNLWNGNWTSALAYNYKVKFVPVPFLKPLGKVKAGLATYSPHKASDIKRHQFPGNFSWPKRIYFLDRCFMVMRFPYKGKELLIINTHNSAYDDGSLKADQMEFLKTFISDEYANGNYVIVGGDWNQCPPGYDCYGKFTMEEVGYEQSSVDPGYMPEGWNWAYDDAVHTNRKLSAPYEPETTFTTVIDYFLVSPNISILKTEGLELNFEYSDHQPVKLSIRLN